MFGVAVLSFWHVHAKDYASEAEEHPEAEVTAVWDEDKKRGQVEASERGVPFHDDLDELLSCGDVDGQRDYQYVCVLRSAHLRQSNPTV